jgi:hypothetical protein
MQREEASIHSLFDYTPIAIGERIGWLAVSELQA